MGPLESVEECSQRYKVTKQTIIRSVRRLHVTEYRPAPNVIRLDRDEVDRAFSGHLVERGSTEQAARPLLHPKDAHELC